MTTTKRQHCVGIVKELLKADALIEMTEQLHRLALSTALYDDPRIEQTKYGPVSKRIAEGTWPRARFPRDHVANRLRPGVEIDRGLRKDISIQEALANADAYLNDQEEQARERIGG